MGAISPNLDFKSDPAECIMCMDCAVPCPKRAITFEPGKLVTWNNEFDPTRREVLGTIGTSAVAGALLMLDVGQVKAAKSTVLRPPGAQNADFLAKCVRCGQCIQVCPGPVLRASECLNELDLVENANSIILRMDNEGRITFFNEFAQQFFGYTESEILGRSVLGTIVPETDSHGRDQVRMIRQIFEQAERYQRVYCTTTMYAVDEFAAAHETIIAAVRMGDGDAAEQATRADWRLTAERHCEMVGILGERGNW